jgi:exo-beta-1,3-glucanase (GH17 family)/cellulose synthase/poly-beta-1,6-N-acetylglucosamine synthase-like glycosyltransferase
MRSVNLALALVSLATVGVWFSMDWQVAAPDWQGKAYGFSYNPSGSYTNELADHVSRDRIKADLTQLAKIGNHVRTYSVSRGLDQVPCVAAEVGLKGVGLGIWLGSDRSVNDQEISTALKAIRECPGIVDRVFVGNEAFLRGELTADEITAYMRRVKRALPYRIPVSTAEPWNVLVANPGLVDAADFVGAHFIPFWEGISAEDGFRELKLHVTEMEKQFKGKPIFIAEVGWPSAGRPFKSAIPATANQAAFLRTFVSTAQARGWPYYIIEAYDQPWKGAQEGAVGAYWGVFDAEGRPKFDFRGVVSSLPEWPWIALVAILFSVAAGAALLRRTPHLGFKGILFLAGGIAILVSGAIGIFWGASLQYADLTTILVYAIVIPVSSFAAAVMLTEGIEMAHAMWRMRRRPMLTPTDAAKPFVSIHVPCYNEPPEMVAQTLNALARLDYPDFEVILLDNNTQDQNVWKPVQEHCAALGPRFRFFHFDNVHGYKAGALNIAMTVTDPRAEIVAVIDSDYQVEPNWLTVATAHFADAKVGLVQAPQDYRDADESTFKHMAYEEYAGFFRIGMVERHEDNAIIQHGTMTMMRKQALIDVGGWAEWCITEDTELGLRLFQAGWESVYIDASLGRGVMPDTLAAYKAQRHRWVYGAMQIFKRHMRALMTNSTKLSSAQKYHFVSGWMPWVADALAFFFTIGGIAWTMAMFLNPKGVDVPMASLAAVALALFAVKVSKTLLVYPYRVKSGMMGAIRASIAGLSLSHTVARAVLSGIFTSGKPFLRTPKLENAAAFRQVVAVAWEEIALLAALIWAIGATIQVRGTDDPSAMIWMAMLAVQALPYAATLAMAIISVLPQTAHAPKPRSIPEPDPAPELAPEFKQAA